MLKQVKSRLTLAFAYRMNIMQTFGKGIIQTIRELSDQNGGVAVTVARYETPKHNDINKAGIPVDETTDVECPKNDALACIPSSML